MEGGLKILWALMLGAVLLMPMGCRRTRPQMPANRHKQVDSTELALALLTQRMVEGANADVARYVQDLDTTYTLAARGYWYCKTQCGQGDALKKDSEARVRVVVQDLQGNVLDDSEVDVTVGKQALPIALDEYLLQMCVGEKASLIVPWYAAYGATGTNTIPAYTNVRVAIEVIE